MIRNIPINPKLSLKGCWTMVNRVGNFEKLNIAYNWLRANEVITNEEYNDLMMTLSYISRELYRQ